ncbi:Gfo/Idh/MocA family protein [Liquorilactobacillus satsumensis]|uniref:Oxidoreductase n=1 Tax=Liquorilactobacillus satsumensis DSM 16230 = JCM 12392 TaxID=1423801 RepID=A0A0R1V390_9LACO|nr:Gfo/Idh/MocA family oxidoreductase [Liquorilactobacillus satsumensis]KRL97704.1 oxidoreductase [Liquorilactobacillus satsumensis DSM 16230 = JCM 12392]MCC7666531.1 gfo/Idh/MocA family oxidoreductase [Liquorilactobacillus satsumensis]MCP9357503.1 Gfo/Idh/MocA family oxidoreductase [Liquorilactobacillus satsumensis]MCP9371331.1 Gfo/Idh/MocA family oxidoreductase [Liquorilactobacillus satsumensis]
MKIGVIGLGDNVQKAYLPTFVKMYNTAEFIFASDNAQVRSELMSKYHLLKMVSSLDELFAAGIEACFIHVPAPLRCELTRRCLEKDIHVFVDGPLRKQPTEVKQLQELALAHSKIFMIGFNRRFAPLVERLKETPAKQSLFLQKNITVKSRNVEELFYNDFLPVLDAAIYLLDSELKRTIPVIKQRAGKLESATLILETAATTAILTMNFQSKVASEIYEVTSENGISILNELTSLRLLHAENEELLGFGDWDSPLKKRGYEQMVRLFVNAVKSETSTNLRQKNILLSYKLCAEMLQEYQQQIK